MYLYVSISNVFVRGANPMKYDTSQFEVNMSQL